MALACPPFLASPRCYATQIWKHWQVKVFFPATTDEVLNRVRMRAEANAVRGSCEVVTCKCDCGRCSIKADYGGIRFSTVCHCSICRAHNQAHGGLAIPFAAVKRDACHLVIAPDGENSSSLAPVSWAESSDVARRLRCNNCSSTLVMDYEHFEPNTIWLCNPTLTRDGKTAPLEEFTKTDCDVCWSSRHVPIPTAGVDARVEFDKLSEKIEEASTSAPYPPPRGLVQFEDLDWGLFPLDAGKN